MKLVETVYTYNNEYKIDKLTELINSFKLTPIAFGKQTPQNYGICDWRNIADMEIIYTVSGTTYVEFRDKIYTLADDDFIIIPSFTPHKIYTKTNDIHTNYWLHFTTFPFFKQFELFNILTQNEYVIHFNKSNHIIDLFEKLAKTLEEHKLGYYLVFANILTEIILLIISKKHNNISELSKICAKQYSQDQILIEKCQSYIHENLSKKITITDLCGFLSISESKLYKTFSKVIDIAPNQFILYSKLKQAQILLLSSTLSIKEIALSLGFSTPYYFSNVFKKYYGISPYHYKNKNPII